MIESHYTREKAKTMPSILLVEDDQTIRITVEFALTKAGYAVTTATDGEAALECAYKVNVDAARVRVAGKIVELRTKEYKLLVALASRPGALATRQWLAEEVWGEEFLSTSRTIDTHVRRIRKAIDKDGWTYIQTAHGMGYRFEAIREDD